LGITPNGNWEFWLAFAERWSLRIPERPHFYLTPQRLRLAEAKRIEVIKHKTFLAVPAGPSALSQVLYRFSFCSAWRGGFFQFLAAINRVLP
jgi:hypothetical protein